MENYPAFFKFFIPHISANQLKIPPAFIIQCIEEALPETVALRDRYNNLWQVKVEEIENNWYFTDGWQVFVEDNFIKGGEVIVFFYLCRGLFQIKIYGSSAFETKGVGGPKCENTEEHSDMSNVTEERQAMDEMIEQEPGDGTRQENQQGNDGEKQSDDGEAATSATRSGNQGNFDWYGTEIFRSGLLPQPMNPYFVTKARPRKCELYIPKDVINYHKLELPEVVKLVDSRGQEFHAVRKIRNDGRIFYTEGWKRLCDMNFVGNKDKCICEFIQQGGGDLHINVTFIRANGQLN